MNITHFRVEALRILAAAILPRPSPVSGCGDVQESGSARLWFVDGGSVRACRRGVGGSPGHRRPSGRSRCLISQRTRRRLPASDRGRRAEHRTRTARRPHEGRPCPGTSSRGALGSRGRSAQRTLERRWDPDRLRLRPLSDAGTLLASVRRRRRADARASSGRSADRQPTVSETG